MKTLEKPSGADTHAAVARYLADTTDWRQAGLSPTPTCPNGLEQNRIIQGLGACTNPHGAVWRTCAECKAALRVNGVVISE